MKGTIPIPKAIPSASKPSPFLKNPNLLNYKSIPCYIGCSSSFWFLFKFKFRRQIIFLQIGETTRRRALEAARDQFWSLNIFDFFVISSREYFVCLLYQCTLLCFSFVCECDRVHCLATLSDDSIRRLRLPPSPLSFSTVVANLLWSHPL